MAIYQEKKQNKITKDGRSWYYKTYYTDMYGKRKQKVSKMYKTKKEAKDAERDFLNIVQYEDIPDYDISFESVYNEWLDYKKSQVKSTTFYARKKRANYHIIPYFKDYKLHSIKVNSINNWKNKILDLEISLEHKNRIITDLKEILEYAKDNYNFDIKVISKLQKYKIESIEKEKESQWNFWTYEEFTQFISAVDDMFYYTMFNFMYYTGLRLGEVMALTWKDINLDKKTLRVNKTLSNKVENQVYIITEPKTKNSIRTIDLDDMLIELLKQYRLDEEKIYNFNENMFLFGNIKYIAPTTFKRYLYKYIEMANVKKITPHGFRHSHVSLLINIGCDSRDVANRVGDTIQMIEKTYYHMFPEKKSNTVNALNNLKIRGK